jgi:hypothetical protein
MRQAGPLTITTPDNRHPALGGDVAQRDTCLAK